MTYAHRSSGSRSAMFLRALLVLAVLVLGVPAVLMAAARARFGGSSPWHGVPSPTGWEVDRIRSALTDRLTEETIADIVVRACLLVVWTAVIVVVATVVVEIVHMVRHAGMPLPDVRGLGWSQSVARVVAVGLLVIVPMFGTASRAVARGGVTLGPVAPSTSVDAARPENLWMTAIDGGPESGATGVAARASDHVDASTRTELATSPEVYVVRAGDSIYGIAERLAGSDEVGAYADALLELNLGRRMADGQHFANAAYIEVGWELELPPRPEPPAADDEVHVVERGESLWSIAEDEMGDATRWPELFEANRGREFADGGALDDPDLIRPGWELNVPGTEPDRATDEPPPTDDPPPPEIDGEVHGDLAAAPDLDGADPTSGGVAEGRGGGVAPPSPGVVASSASAPDGDTDGAAIGTTADLASRPTAGGFDPRPQNTWSDEVPGPEVRLLSLERAAMLSAGVLALLGVRRRRQLRRAAPRARLPIVPSGPAVVERALRTIDAGDRFARVEVALRAVAAAAVASAAAVRVAAVVVADDGHLIVHLTGPMPLGAPWTPGVDPTVWELPAATPIELLIEDAGRWAAPCPAIVQLGRTHDLSDVYVDVEALEAIEVGGPGDQADAVVRAVAATLAGSVLAEVVTLVGVGVDDDAFLGHRRHVPVRDVREAFETARDAVGSTASVGRSTFELRASASGGEAWEPAVVLAGSAVGTVVPPADRTGLAVVSASPIQGPSSRLAPDGDSWTLLPLGLRFVPVGLTTAQAADLAGLVASADAEPVNADAVDDAGPVLDLVDRRSVDLDDDLTLVPLDDDLRGDADQRGDDREPALLVRLLGPVGVEAADGRQAGFERSKSRELVVWLATHRERATRTSARTALWELDVRDSTFANVVSEARRTLARLVEAPDGEEWIARTLTEALPLHPLVRTDVELLEEALDRSRSQPPAQAIATLSPAVELVVGPPFEGTSYLWPDAEGMTSQLVLLATSATAELAGHHLSVGNVAGVLEATGRGLRVLPGHEELIALRMQAHARTGDQAAVRHEWEQYERVIHADPWSDGEPAERLVRLRLELLAR